jgi:hypothetical protein
MVSLIALARAGFTRAKVLHRMRLGAHVVGLLAGLGALFAPAPWAYVLSLVVLLAEGVAWFLRHNANQQQSAAEEARRRGLLIDALGIDEEPLDTTDLRRRFSSHLEAAAQNFEDENYYASKEPPGLERLRTHLQESAFWSKGLYEAAAQRSFRIWGVVAVSVVLVSYFAQPFAAAATAEVAVKAMVIFLTFLPATDGFGQGLGWATAAKQAEAIDRRLERLDAQAKEPLIAAFADYAVAVGSTAPIPAWVYNAERERLNTLWRERKGIPEQRKA